MQTGNGARCGCGVGALRQAGRCAGSGPPCTLKLGRLDLMLQSRPLKVTECVCLKGEWGAERWPGWSGLLFSAKPGDWGTRQIQGPRGGATEGEEWGPLKVSTDFLKMWPPGSLEPGRQWAEAAEPQASTRAMNPHLPGHFQQELPSLPADLQVAAGLKTSC